MSMKKFIAFYRVSSNSQEENTSLEIQKARINSWAKACNHQIVHEVEAVESATRTIERRKLFKHALELMDSSNCDGLIVYDLDRFFRNAEEGLRCARINFLEQGRVLLSLNQNIDISTHDGWFTFGIFLLVAEKEARTMRRRVTEGKLHKAASSLCEGRKAYIDGALPFGFSSSGVSGRRELEIDPSEYPWRQKIFAWRAEGRSYKWIARELNSRGVKTKRGLEWRDTTIRLMLVRPMALHELMNQAISS